jgi:hypothetical protein
MLPGTKPTGTISQCRRSIKKESEYAGYGMPTKLWAFYIAPCCALGMIIDTFPHAE